MAQRMESVARPGTVMLSDSTARLVEDATVLADPEPVHIKGSKTAVTVRRLLSVVAARQNTEPIYSPLVGREWELATLEEMLKRSMAGRGCVVGVAGRAGRGKSRLVREILQIAESRGAKALFTVCESHTSDVPFQVVARLLRAYARVEGMDDQTAREKLRAQALVADPQDLLLLDDLLGIADPAVPLPNIDPDARRRRLTAVINDAQLARHRPLVYVIEDVHWMDEASESLLADFLAVIPQSPSLVLLTYRPDYDGVLRHVPGAQSVDLARLSDGETSALATNLLGRDPSVSEIAEVITAHAAGNPFFAEEMVRELAESGVLVGTRGAYTCATGVDEVVVPATLQATLAARIDRLSPLAKRTLMAAAVIGSRFTADLLLELGVEPQLEELIDSEYIAQVRFTPPLEYAFRHPLNHAVAYESQLKSDRAQLHRQLAAAIEARDPESVDQNAALVAEHLEAAGDLRAAYGWRMRAAGWANDRDIAAAQLSWERARKIADALPADVSDRPALRIAPRVMLCGNAFRIRMPVSDRFGELRELCDAVGDKASLAIGMAGLVMDHLQRDRMREASQSASDGMALIETLDNPSLAVGLAVMPIYAKSECGEWTDVLRWSQLVIDLADGDPAKGNFFLGCPLAFTLAARANARACLGIPGWRDDLQRALAMARDADPMSYAAVVGFLYSAGIPAGSVRSDDQTMREIEEAVKIAERSSDNMALAIVRMTLGIALVHRPADAERERGQWILSGAQRNVSAGALPVGRSAAGDDLSGP